MIWNNAFDTVWREGLLVKLFRMGIKGIIWNLLKDFLSNREAVCCIGENMGDRINTKMKLPQDSVLSPLLFNLFLADYFENVSRK